jgi:hypothetical protein
MEADEEVVVEEDAFEGYVEDVLADICWSNLCLCEWFKYEGKP